MAFTDSSFTDSSFIDAAEVDAARGRALADCGDAWLLDVREDAEWAAGHAASAHHIPMMQLQARLHELPEDTQLLVICHSGGRSAMVTSALRGAGLPAANVVGVMLAWQADGGEVVHDDGSAGHLAH
jgi:rhodanese-related sulfurtransferase